MIDLHVHSTASDGTVSPTELAQRGESFSVMAITDHDNCDGVDEFLAACAESGAGSGEKVRLAGIELSVEPGEGYEKFHLLGLGIDPGDEGLKRFLRRVLDGRNERNARIIDRFAEIGIDIPPEEIATYAHGEVLARPHFANWLVDHGYSSDVRTAFNDYLTPSSPTEKRCYITRYHPDPGEAFDVIHSAGGIAVMAHPKYWRDEWKRTGCDFAAAKKELQVLKEKGLDGLEALYEANTEEENVEFSRIASRLGLLKSAGSDFHGANKPSIALGIEVSEEFISPLLERI